MQALSSAEESGEEFFTPKKSRLDSDSVARGNLGNLALSEKRNVLESLGIRVIVEKGASEPEGIMLIVSGQCA